MTAEPYPEQPIRLVVTDVDGTLVTHDKRLTPRAQRAIDGLKSRKIAFTIISARPPVGVHKLVEHLDLDGPVGAVNGGALLRRDLTIIERVFLDPDEARESVRFLRSKGLDPWLFTETEWYLRDPDGPHVEHEKMTLDMDWIQVEDYEEAWYDRTLKIVGASNDHPHLERCEAELQALLGTRAAATRSQAYYLDVTHPDAVKGNGLLGMARLLDLPIESVMSLGDGVNDITMLQSAGFSVGMGNATDHVKSFATVITDDCDHDGFAKAIERYVLDDPRRDPPSDSKPHIHEDRADPEDAPR